MSDKTKAPRVLDTVSDRDLNRMIGDLLGRDLRGVGILLHAMVQAEWRRRHPGTLPPCYKSIPFPPCYEGTRTIYSFDEEATT